ncbi:MAG: DUF342 domain-containing protein [Candidatus Latescibacteria bacterium]|jgi:uncharacterized protein|nr:DUF342 domain-containing protein [Candidatus Latescibacterota bacterium]
MAKKTLDKSIRKRINNRAWMRLEISDNARMAFIRGLYLGGDAAIGVTDVIDTLHKEYGITVGIDEEVIGRILEEVSAEPNRVFSSKGIVVVAHAARPVQGRDGEVEFHFLTEKLKRTPLSYEALTTAFEQKDPVSVSRAGVLVRATYPGEKLATLHKHRSGKPGQDIFGRIVTPVSTTLPKQVYLSAGNYVREEDGEFFADIYGFVCVLDDQISVLPALHVLSDGSEAHFIHFPQADPICLPQLDWINQMLVKMEIAQEITSEKLVQIHQFINERRSGSGHMLLVEGTRPVPGQDGYVVLHFGEDRTHMLPDGRVDVVSRRTALGVKSGERIAEIILPTIGIPGESFNGREIPAAAGKVCTVKTSERVRVELEGGNPRFFYSKNDGNASYDGNTLDVRSVLRISGDVDRLTGDIQYDQDVEIIGSVRKGAKVSAGGTVLVVGAIDDGGAVTAKRDVVVGEGIAGKSAKVVALGHVETRHIEYSTVIARKDVVVGNRILHGQVRAGGRLTVGFDAGENGGHIVGGEVLAGLGIEAEQLGSGDESNTTLVGVVPSIELEARLKKLDESIDFCNTNILKIFRTLNIQALNPQLIEGILRRTPPGRKKAIADLLVKLKGLIVYRDESLSGHKAVQAEIDEAFAAAEIKVRKTAHADVQVKIGSRSLMLQQDEGRVTFSVSDDGIQCRKTDDI